MPNETPPIPARIHVLLAREAPFAAVIRRGPSKRVCTLGWNLKTDVFTLGQWLKGQFYPLRSDLSPDGKHLLYFAADFGDELRTWTAISRAPYLKATGFWPKGDAWHGGGLWIDNTNYWINDGGSDHRQVRKPANLVRKTQVPYFENFGGEDPGVYFLRLKRDGWKLKTREKPYKHHEITHFEKRFGANWKLTKIFHATLNHPVARGCYFETHQMENRASGEVFDGAAWEWAEIWGKRLLWAQNGQIWAAKLGDSGFFAPKMLRDLNAMKFQPIAAPY